MNVVILHGRLVRDPVVREIKGGDKTTSVVNFTVATNRYYKKAGSEESSEEVTFVDCEAWDSGAVTIGKYLKKGDPILLRGALKLESWEKDGQKHSRLKVRVENFDLVGSKKSGDAPVEGDKPSTEQRAQATVDSPNTDIPF